MTLLITYREIFGTSEDEAPELDHSEDSDNGRRSHRISQAYSDSAIAKEIATLRQESQALKQIRQSMGSDDFPRKVFDKVFKDDIDRLRSMEEMWKTRRPPEALDYDAIKKDASDMSPNIAQQDQQTWTLADNFVVFSDRYVTQALCQKQIFNSSKSTALECTASGGSEPDKRWRRSSHTHFRQRRCRYTRFCRSKRQSKVSGVRH